MFALANLEKFCLCKIGETLWKIGEILWKIGEILDKIGKPGNFEEVHFFSWNKIKNMTPDSNLVGYYANVSIHVPILIGIILHVINFLWFCLLSIMWSMTSTKCNNSQVVSKYWSKSGRSCNYKSLLWWRAITITGTLKMIDLRRIAFFYVFVSCTKIIKFEWCIFWHVVDHRHSQTQI